MLFVNFLSKIELLLFQDTLPQVNEIYDSFYQSAKFYWENTYHDKGVQMPEIYLPNELEEPFHPDQINAIPTLSKSIKKGLSLVGVDSTGNEKDEIKKRVKDISDSLDRICQRCIQDDYSIEHINFVYRFMVMANDFVQKVILSCLNSSCVISGSSISEGKPIKCVFRGCMYPVDDLQYICENLIDNNWVEQDTNLNDFAYFFSGQGEIPTSKIRWRTDTNKLCVLLKMLSNDTRIWNKATKTFAAQDSETMQYGELSPYLRQIYKAYLSSTEENHKKIKKEVRKVFEFE